MEGPPVAGTPEQLLLLTLAKKLDDMDERLGARIDALAHRILNPCERFTLAETKPPSPETAEEESHRIAGILRQPDVHACRVGICYALVGRQRYMRVGGLRHQVNKDALRKNGFHIAAEWDAPGAGGEALLSWWSTES